MVTRFYGGDIVVNIANAPVIKNPGRLDTYQPALGDLVVLMRQGDNWTIIGAYINSVSDNLVTNGNFSDGFNVSGQGGGALTNWGQNTLSLAANHTITQDARDADFNTIGEPLTSRYIMVHYVSTTAAGTSSVQAYSDPISVLPGQVYTASSFMRGVIDSGMTVYGQMGIGWYAGSGYATYDAHEDSSAIYLPVNTWRKLGIAGPLGAGAVVPSGMNYARVILYTNFRTDAADAVSRRAFTMWNRAVLKRLG